MGDTPEEVQKEVRFRLMQRSPEERFFMGVASHVAARKMVLASLPVEASLEEKRRHLFRRFYGGEKLPMAMVKAFGGERGGNS
jgi:hypothetical protein